MSGADRHALIAPSVVRDEEKRLVLQCNCGCTFAVLAEWLACDDEDVDQWLLEIYISPGPKYWRWRVRQAWRLLTGRDVSSHDIVLDPVQIAELRDWLNRWVAS